MLQPLQDFVAQNETGIESLEGNRLQNTDVKVRTNGNLIKIPDQSGIGFTLALRSEVEATVAPIIDTLDVSVPIGGTSTTLDPTMMPPTGALGNTFTIGYTATRHDNFTGNLSFSVQDDNNTPTVLADATIVPSASGTNISVSNVGGIASFIAGHRYTFRLFGTSSDGLTIEKTLVVRILAAHEYGYWGVSSSIPDPDTNWSSHTLPDFNS